LFDLVEVTIHQLLSLASAIASHLITSLQIIESERHRSASRRLHVSAAVTGLQQLGQSPWPASHTARCRPPQQRPLKSLVLVIVTIGADDRPIKQATSAERRPCGPRIDLVISLATLPPRSSTSCQRSLPFADKTSCLTALAL